MHPIPAPNIVQVSSLQSNISENMQHDTQLRETFELQPINSGSRIINVAPINVENRELQLNVNNFQPNDQVQTNNSPIGPENTIRLQPSNPVIMLTLQNSVSNQMIPPMPLSAINTNKYNKNLISLTGSIFLLVTLVSVGFICSWNLHNSNDVSTFVFLWYVLDCCFSVGLPTLYFILNPKHLIIAVQYLPCSR